ncbi:hypothetical protein PG988_016117 [Apiospora saccharicola]
MALFLKSFPINGIPTRRQRTISPSPEREARDPPSFTQKSYLDPDFVPRHLNKISQESIILGGGAAAILLQVANPAVGAGVHEHSNFAHRVPDRLRSTMTYIYCMSFGTPQEKQRLADMITRVHVGVRGTVTEGPDEGTRYSALDPHLQLWVAATLYAVAIDIYQRAFGPGAIADEDEHERIYAEYAILACALQVPPDMWPQTRADFWRYWDGEAPWYLRLFLPAVRVVTAEWLPPDPRGVRVQEAPPGVPAARDDGAGHLPGAAYEAQDVACEVLLGRHAEEDGEESRGRGQRGIDS